jgi:tRNA modification GTPase
LPFVAREELDRRLTDAVAHVAAIERQMTSRAESVDFVRVVLIGRPNAGKSSLFNALAGGPSALVSHHPGTTRDYLTAEIDLDGVKCRLIDTAGIESLPHVEPSVGHASQLAAEGQRHSAHVQVLCIDSTRPMDDWERNELLEATAPRLVALTKCDSPQANGTLPDTIETSSLTGEGLELLRDELRRRAGEVTASQGDVVASTAARCRESLRLAGECLHRAKYVAAGGQEELAAAEIRVALEEIGKVVGTVYTDDILDRIFSRFCIGK